MTRHALPFRAAGDHLPARPGRPPDVAVAALPLLRRLRGAIEAAAAVHAARRRAEAKRRWGVPPLFFFDTKAQAAWDEERKNARPAGRRTTLPETGAQAQADLAELADDAITVLAGSPEVRRAARAVPGLRAAAEAFAPDDPKCRRLAGLLAIPDDLVILALHPAARAGWRVRLSGVADLGQFHVLLADAVAGSPSRGFLPGPRPDDRVVEAYRGGDVDPAAGEAAARFQLYRPAALQPDGTLPAGFRGADEWLWEHESPAAVPAVAGERVVLLGDPPYPRTWPAGRRFPLVRGDLDLLDVLTPAAVGDWLRTLAGPTPAAAARRAA